MNCFQISLPEDVKAIAELARNHKGFERLQQHNLITMGWHSYNHGISTMYKLSKNNQRKNKELTYNAVNNLCDSVNRFS